MSADMKKLIEMVSQLTAEVAELRSEASSSKTKVKKEKRAVTNVEGPAAWNLFVKETQKSMASAAGVDVSSIDEAAFKKTASAKDSGFSWQSALKEASRRKAEAEGRDPKPKTAKTPKVSTASAPVAPKKIVIKDEEAIKRAEFAELNMIEFEFDGKSYWLQEDCHEIYEIAGPHELGERLGVWDMDSESIDSTQ